MKWRDQYYTRYFIIWNVITMYFLCQYTYEKLCLRWCGCSILFIIKFFYFLNISARKWTEEKWLLWDYSTNIFCVILPLLPINILQNRYFVYSWSLQYVTLWRSLYAGHANKSVVFPDCTLIRTSHDAGICLLKLPRSILPFRCD